MANQSNPDPSEFTAEPMEIFPDYQDQEQPQDAAGLTDIVEKLKQIDIDDIPMQPTRLDWSPTELAILHMKAEKLETAWKVFKQLITTDLMEGESELKRKLRDAVHEFCVELADVVIPIIDMVLAEINRSTPHRRHSG